MRKIITEELAALINDPEADKVISTVDREGVPHSAFKESLRADQDGTLFFYEYIETSVTNKNLVSSIWFKKKVSVLVRKGTKSVQITGIPDRVIIAGRRFREAYQEVRKEPGDFDLSGIWIIRPLEAKDQTLLIRKKEEEEIHPILKHLDRILQSGI